MNSEVKGLPFSAGVHSTTGFAIGIEYITCFTDLANMKPPTHVKQGQELGSELCIDHLKCARTLFQFLQKMPANIHNK